MFLIETLQVKTHFIIPNSFDPNLKYTLTKYNPIKYSSLKKCIDSEVKKSFSHATSNYNYILNMDQYKTIIASNLTEQLADPSNPLTDDEIASIYLYTCRAVYSDEFSRQLRTGKVGNYNCYMDYLLSAMNKLKIPEQVDLFRGVGDYETGVLQTIHSGDKIILNSFTSTSSSFNTALNFAFPLDEKNKRHGIFYIKSLSKNSRRITEVSQKSFESEYLYPPMTKFVATSDPYLMKCIVTATTLSECYRANSKTISDSSSASLADVWFLDVSEVDETPSYIEEKNPFPKEKKCKSGCSACKELEYDGKMSSKVLGNIQIHDVYIGSSSIVDFDVGYRAMNAARKILGHAIPPPNFLHPSFWVGPKNATNSTSGAVFVYGEYHSSNEATKKTFLSNDGARSYVLTLGEFLNKYENPIRVVPGKNINLSYFTKKIKNSGKWDAKSYKWRTNNCQHFVAQCMNILDATRYSPNDNDWIILPSRILKVLKSNEHKFNEPKIM